MREELAAVRPKKELIAVGDSYGRSLAEEIFCRSDVPPHDRSHMDGFAVRGEDLDERLGHSARLLIGDETPVGIVPVAPLEEMEARPILTGGYLPRGADTILPRETVDVRGRSLTARGPVRRGSFVYERGTDMRKGERVLELGRLIRAQEVGLLASLGFGRLCVFTRPIVAIIPTGSELTPKIEDAEAGKVVESHSLVLSWLITSAGGVPLQMGIAGDEIGAISAKLRDAVSLADIVLTIAGSSVGGPDLVESAINRSGSPGVLVHGIRIHRGRVVGFGRIHKKPVVILPGPIQSAINGFAVFAYPLIRVHLGQPFGEPPRVLARLSKRWEATGSFKNFAKVVYVKTASSEHGLSAEAVTGETEKMTLLTNTNGYMLVPEIVTQLEAGSLVEVRLLPGFSGALGQ
jgi:molybdopterin biosynthesis enzyme